MSTCPTSRSSFWHRCCSWRSGTGSGPRSPSVVLASLSYNFLFTAPYYSFSIEQPENVTAIIVFTVVAIITSTLAARSRARTFVARQEAARSAALYSFARKLAGVATMDDLLWAAAHQIASMLKVEVVLLLPEGERLALQAAYPPEDQLSDADLAAATWCWQKDQAAGRGADTLPGAPRLFLPMRTGRGKLGVVGIRSDVDGPLLTPDERRLLDALLDQTAVAIERVQLARDVDETRLLAETERLRTALLTSLGHDLKTPLASILGTISSLRSFGALYDDATRDEMLGTAQEEAERLARFLDNLRDMTRLEAGALGSKREPVDLADAVGSALRRVQRLVSGHRVVTDLPTRPAPRAGRFHACRADPREPARERRPLHAQGRCHRDRGPARGGWPAGGGAGRGPGHRPRRDRPDLRQVLPRPGGRPDDQRDGARPCRLQGVHRGHGRHHPGAAAARPAGNDRAHPLSLPS